MFMSKDEKQLLEALRNQVNGLTAALRFQSCGEKLKPRIYYNGSSFGVFESKPLERPCNNTDIDAHERINALCEALGYTVECEPERYVVRKKKKAQTNR